MKQYRQLLFLAATACELGLLACGTPATTEWARAPQVSADERGSPVHEDAAVIWADDDRGVLGRTFPGFDPGSLPTQPIRELVRGERTSSALAIQFCGDAHFVAYETAEGVRGRFWNLDLTRPLSPVLPLGSSRATLLRTAWHEEDGWLAVLWKSSQFDQPMGALLNSPLRRVVQTEAVLLGPEIVRDIDIAASRRTGTDIPFMVSFSSGPQRNQLSVQVALVGVLSSTLVAGTFQTVSPSPSWYSDVAIDYYTPSDGYYTLYANHIATEGLPETGDNRLRGALIDSTGTPIAHHDLAERVFWRTLHSETTQFVFLDDRHYDLDMAINPNGVIDAVYTQADRTLTSVPDFPNLWAYSFSLLSISPDLVWRRRPAPLDASRHTDGRSMFQPRIVWSFNSLAAYEEGSPSPGEDDWMAHVVPAR